MRLLIIPDLHGVSSWKEQVVRASLHKEIHIVFLGDYLDSFVFNTHQIITNLEEIIELKKKLPDRITLLLGNHEYAYIFKKFNTSGTIAHMYTPYYNLLQRNIKLFDIAWGHTGPNGYTLVTHAGLTQHFYDSIVSAIKANDSSFSRYVNSLDKHPETLPLHELLNYVKNDESLLWKVGLYRKGISKTGSIIWADKRELLYDAYPGIDQIVGHTYTPYVDIHKVNGRTIYFTDTHDEDNNKVVGTFLSLE